jgi:hypothetical protein
VRSVDAEGKVRPTPTRALLAQRQWNPAASSNPLELSRSTTDKEGKTWEAEWKRSGK